ncbi:MAG: insulinase family protein [bacterium]|nr:insulinase family protein [bacterium]
MASIRVRRVPGAPVVAVRVWLPGGSTAETLPGQALVSGRLLLEGTRTRSWRVISEAAEKRGAAMVADAGYEAQGLAIDALADDWELALDWAAELVLSSVFPQERCRWLARQAAAELEQLADHPDVKTSWAFARQLYGTGARGRPLQGSVESLESLEAEACESFHRSCLQRGAIVTVAGDIVEGAVEAKLLGLFGGLPSPGGLPSTPADSGGETVSHQEVELEESEQAHWFGGAVTASRRDPDYWPLGLVGIVLGAGGHLNGRISRRVRELEGLAYSCSIATVAGAGREAGSFTVAAGTSPERVDEVGVAVAEELEALVHDGVTQEELRDARAYLLGSEPFARETARQWATLLAQAELFGVPLDDSGWVTDRWLAVTEGRALEVARLHLDPRRLRVTVGRGHKL